MPVEIICTDWAIRGILYLGAVMHSQWFTWYIGCWPIWAAVIASLVLFIPLAFGGRFRLRYASVLCLCCVFLVGALWVRDWQQNESCAIGWIKQRPNCRETRSLFFDSGSGGLLFWYRDIRAHRSEEHTSELQSR